MDKTGEVAIDNAKVVNQINKFRKYAGTVTGVQVKECISAAIAHNSNLNSDEFNYAVRVNIGGILISTDASTGLAKINAGQDYVIRSTSGGKQPIVDELSTKVDNSKKYACKVHYMENVGTIDAIVFNVIAY